MRRSPGHFFETPAWQRKPSRRYTASLVVFLIQYTQNRDTKALHLKIDELLKVTRGARNSLIDLDRLTDAQLRKLELEFKKLCDQATRD